MSLNKLRQAANRKPWVVFAVLLLISTFLMGWAAHSSKFLINTDGISYISVSKYYASGQFDLAINAWLPPLISWLAVPFHLVGIDEQLSAYLVNVVLGVLILGLGMLMVWRYTKKKYLPVILFWAALTPFLVYAVGRFITPDLAILLWILVFMLSLIRSDSILKSDDKYKHLKAGLLLGAVGAVGYFIKLFLLFYFIAAVAGWALIRFFVFRDKRKKLFSLEHIKQTLLTPVIAGLSLFVFILPWLFLVENKYDSFTIGSSFAYNTNVDEIRNGGGVALKPPPHDEAVTFLEDVTELTKQSSGGGIKSDIRNIDVFVTERFEILPIYIGDIILLSPLIVFTMLAVGAALLFNKINYKKYKFIILAALLAVVNFMGYLAAKSPPQPGVTRGVERYNWPLLLLSLLIIAVSLPALWEFIKKQDLVRRSAFILLILAIPVITYVKFMPDLDRLFGEPRKQSYNALADELVIENIIPEGSRIAGNNARPLMPTAYFLNSQTFGSTGELPFNSTVVQAELDKHSIDYYFYFSPTNAFVPIDVSGTNAVPVAELNFARFPCRDVRYGPVGAGIPPEACTLTIVEL